MPPLLNLEFTSYLFFLSLLSKPWYHVETSKYYQFLSLQNIFLSIKWEYFEIKVVDKQVLEQIIFKLREQKERKYTEEVSSLGKEYILLIF